MASEDEVASPVGGETPIGTEEEGRQIVELARAWPRFWARMFDTWLNVALLGFLLGLSLPDFVARPIFAGSFGSILLGFLLLPGALLLDALVQARFGNTPGKRIAGIRVEAWDGSRPGLSVILRRNLRIYGHGYVLGLPLLNLFGMAHARSRLAKEGATSWDEALRTRVADRGSNGLRTTIVAALGIALNLSATAFEKYAEHMQPHWDKEAIIAALPEMNRGLPHFFDGVTRSDSVTYTIDDNVLTFNYTLIHRDASPVSADELAPPGEIRASLLGEYCSPNLRFYRERKIPVRYLYRQADGRIALDARFDDPARCPAPRPAG